MVIDEKLIKTFFIHRNRIIKKDVMPYKLTFSSTYACNARCKNCNIWKIYRENPNLIKNELSINEIESFFQKNGKWFYWISLTGGEPFLRNDLVDITKIISEKTSTRILSINTNGIHKDKIINDVKNILSNINNKITLYIVISLDGPRELHNKLRGAPNAYENAEYVYNELKKLTKNSKNLKVYRELLISRYNINYVKELIDDLRRRKIDFTVTFAQESDYYNNTKLNVSIRRCEDKKKIIDVLSHLIRNSILFNVRNESVINILFYRIAKKYFASKKPQIIPCYSGFSSILMNPYGDIFPCIMIQESMGNIRNFDYNLKKLMKSKNAIKIKSSIIKGKCPGCWTPCEAYQTIIENFLSNPLRLV